MKFATWQKLLGTGVVLGLLMIGFVGLKLLSVTEKAPPITTPVPGVPTVGVKAPFNCPDTLATTIYTRHKNTDNTSAAYVGVQYRVHEVASDGNLGSYLTNITTLKDTSGTYTDTGSVTWCGKTLRLYPLLANNANAKLGKISVSGADAKLISLDGQSNVAIEVVVKSGDVRMTVEGKSTTGTLEVRSYDKINRAYRINRNQSSGTTWVAVSKDGVIGATYGTTSAGSSAEAIGAGGQLSNEIEIRTSENYQSFGDLGWWIMFDVGSSPTTYWNDFAITVGGATYNSAKGTLTTYEVQRYSDYDWFFFVNDRVMQRSPETKIAYTMDATSNNPSTDVKMTICQRGIYTGVDNKPKIGCSQDDTSTTKVYEDWDVIHDIS